MFGQLAQLYGPDVSDSPTTPRFLGELQPRVPYIVSTQTSTNYVQTGQLLFLGSINSTGSDVDYYSFRTLMAGEVSVTSDGLTPLFGAIYSGENLTVSDTDTLAALSLRFQAASGANYLLEVKGASRNVAGNYRITLATSAVEDYGNNFGVAFPLTSLSSRVLGNLEYMQDNDVFTFSPPTSGQISIFSDGNLDPVAFLFAANGTQMAYDDDSLGVGLNFLLRANVISGQRYFLLVRAYGGYSTGPYGVSFSFGSLPSPTSTSSSVPTPTASPVPPINDVSGDITRPMFLGTLNAGSIGSVGLLRVSSALESVGDVDYFSFRAGVSGLVNVTSISDLDLYGYVYDASNNATITSDDDSGKNWNFLMSFFAQANTVYIVRVNGWSPYVVGRYTLNITIASSDDVGNTIQTARILTTSSGQLQFETVANLGYAEDVDVFGVIAPITGHMTVRSTSNTDPIGAIVLADGTLLAMNDDTNGLDFEVSAPVTAGTRYFVRVTGYAGSEGDYTLTLRFTTPVIATPTIMPSPTQTPVTDDFGNTLDTARALALVNGRVSIQGFLETSGDRDVFSFVAPLTGVLDAQTESFIDTYGLLLNQNGITLAENDDSDGLDFRLFYDVVANVRYYVVVRGFSSSVTGQYNLVLTVGQPVTDGAGNTFTLARNLGDLLPGTSLVAGSLYVTEDLDFAGDEDFFVFTAIASGTVTVSSISGIDLYGYAYDSDQTLLGENDDTIDLDFSLTFSTIAGSQYFIKVRGYFPEEIGPYNMSIVTDAIVDDTQTDDFGNTLADAHALEAFINGHAQVNGVIDYANDVDVFSFVSPITGNVIVESLGSTDPYGYLLNAEGTVLVENDDFNGLNFRLVYGVVANTRYFVKVRGWSESNLGDYSVVIQIAVPTPTSPSSTVTQTPTPTVYPDDVSDTLAGARSLGLLFPGTLFPLSDGRLRIESSLDFIGDVDFFSFAPVVNGNVTIFSNSTLDTFGYIYEGNNTLPIVRDDDSGAGLNFRMTFAARAGQAYYVRVNGYHSSVLGRYGLNIVTDVKEDMANQPEFARRIQPGRYFELGGRIDYSGDRDWFEWVALNSEPVTITTSSYIDTYGHLFGPNGLQIIEDDDNGVDLNFQFTVNVVAGHVYKLMIRGWSHNVQGPYVFRMTFGALAPLPTPLPPVVISASVRPTPSLPPVVFSATVRPTPSAIPSVRPSPTLAPQPQPQPIMDPWFDVSNFPRWAFMLGEVSFTRQIRFESSLYFTDVDFFGFRAIDTGTIEIWTNGTADTVGVLLNATNLNTLATDDDSDVKVNFRITHNIVAGQRFLIRVSGYDASVMGRYALNIKLSPRVEVEPPVVLPAVTPVREQNTPPVEAIASSLRNENAGDNSFNNQDNEASADALTRSSSVTSAVAGLTIGMVAIGGAVALLVVRRRKLSTTLVSSGHRASLGTIESGNSAPSGGRAIAEVRGTMAASMEVADDSSVAAPSTLFPEADISTLHAQSVDSVATNITQARIVDERGSVILTADEAVVLAYADLPDGHGVE